MASMRMFAIALLAGLVGCSASTTRAPVPTGPNNAGFLPAGVVNVGGNSPIKHIVIIVQENRTIDNLFQGYPKPTPPATEKWAAVASSCIK